MPDGQWLQDGHREVPGRRRRCAKKVRNSCEAEEVASE
uniref:Uncharacterized protein n=1 Tax=Siphoviridae sp. ct2773 TaxID=2826275 RepID=A0A8S5QS11_9CAUD|nr:MAG TPA: hypothetical protein [Siphoviridae sp. ct2773]